MCQNDLKHHHHDDEIDLVDLIGNIIKHRKFIMLFVVIFTLVGTLLVGLREGVRLLSSERKFNPNNVLTVEMDPFVASYAFLKQSTNSTVLNGGQDMDSYKKFIIPLIFPSLMDVPDFEIQGSKSSSMNYLFLNEKDKTTFMHKYNSLVDLLNKLKDYSSKMNEGFYSSCRQFYNNRQGTVKEISAYFDNSTEVKICNAYNYYLGAVSNKVSYAMVPGTALPDGYFTFIVDFMNDVEKSKVKPMDKSDLNEIKVKVKTGYNIKKVIKYSVVIFVLSIIISLVLVFFMQFWSNNKVRLKNYWKN